MPAHTIAETGAPAPGIRNPRNAAVGRLTVLLHATSSVPERAEGDVRMLTDALYAILEQVRHETSGW
jgi:hypothetical protein